MSNQVCSNYALALFDLVKDNAKEYKTALKNINALLKVDHDIFKFVCAYGIEKSKVDKVISLLTKDYKLDYLDNFLSLIHKKHRFINFDEIVDEFTHLVNDANGIKEGYVYSSFKLDELQLNSITNALKDKLKCEIELHNIVDSSLLGGVKVSIDGKVFDNTLKTSLENLTKTLLGGSKL